MRNDCFSSAIILVIITSYLFSLGYSERVLSNVSELIENKYISTPTPSSSGSGREDESHNVKDPLKHTYYASETIAKVSTDEYGNITECQIVKAHTWQQKRDAFVKLNANFVSETTFNRMLNIIRECHILDKNSDEDEVEDINYNATKRNEFPIPSVANLWTAAAGILPGTKWCGLKNIAKGWSDLGMDKETDRCCRSHDLCPKTVPAFGRAYGLINFKWYTSSHCECDAMLYDCLKELSPTVPAGPPTSDVVSVVGNFYFNILRLQCITEEHPPKCLSHPSIRRRSDEDDNGSDGISCIEWEEKPSRNHQSLVFREFANKW